MNTFFSSPKPTLAHLTCENKTNPFGIESPFPCLSWQLDSPERNSKQVTYQIQVATTSELLASNLPDIWNSGEIASAQSRLIPYEGPSLTSSRTYHWHVRVVDNRGNDTGYSTPAFWEMGMLSVSDWQAQWIGRPDGCFINWQAPVLPAPLLRKKFSLPAQFSRARVFLCGIGYYELYVNSNKVGNQVLDPVVTQYERHVGYTTFDVTGDLQEGDNTIGVILGNGWYNCSTEEVWHFDKAAWRDYPKLRLQLQVTLADGSEVVVVSDPSWKVSEGPIKFDALRNGEEYDARAEVPRWLDPDFDDKDWKHAAVVPGPGGHLVSQQTPPVTVIETLEAVKNWRIDAKTAVYDFGQNIAGWSQIEAQLPRGAEITLEYSERLDDTGNIEVSHIASFVKSGAFQTDKYTAKGEGIETWNPRFTYHGFRYVRLTADVPPETPISLKAQFISTDFETAGEFTCSNISLNRLQECTQRSYRGNFVGIPTDCPHREKNGWTGDALLAVETGLYNYDASLAYAHWLAVMADTQRPNGEFPGVVPTAGWGYNWGSGPAWDSAFIFIPWYMYQFRGDPGVLQTHYPAMRQYMAFICQMASDGMVRWGLGDWCAPDENATSPAELVTTAYACADSRLMSQTARLLGHHDDAEAFDATAQMFRQAWRREFLGADGQCAGDEQTSLACALYFDMVDAAERPRVVERLVQAIQRADGHLTFGIHGAKWCLRALADAGEIEAAYALLTQPGYPGWFHWLEQGATTLWEDWNGTSSLNHIMFGDVSAWLFAYIAGIQPHPEAPGFSRIVIRPQPVKNLTWARGRHCSPYGVIESSWERVDTGTLKMRVCIPANTTADVTLPTRDAATAEESGIPLLKAGITIQTQDERGMTLSVGSGEYDFLIHSPL